jgi:RNA polymerase sigma-70 factor (ECF subfamily)
MQHQGDSAIHRCLLRVMRGEEGARVELLEAACSRLSELAHVMFRSYRRLRRWEDTADVLQGALLRLHRALAATVPATPRDFYRLATTQIRRELIDLARHHFGPWGHAANVESAEAPEPPAGEGDPARLSAWSDLHASAEALPEEEREAFALIWYQGLTRDEAAEVLGVSTRTVIRRWQSACLSLQSALRGIVPET